jgi:hypothetical protein
MLLLMSYYTAEILTDAEIAHLRHFALKIKTHMSDETFSKLKYAFPDSNVETYKVTRSRAEFLAQLKPVNYDCCINLCCCFVGPHRALDACPYCKQQQYLNGKPQKKFTYIPLIPRLKAFYESQSLDVVKDMQYCSNFQHDPNVIKDVMDGAHYQRLCESFVTVNRQQLPHKFFQDPRDVALGFSTDGFAPFKRRKKTCWPLIIFNYNLPPEKQFWARNTLCLGVIPGPKKPKDADSFLYPAVEEFVKLAHGVRAWDACARDHFWLRAFLIICFGDIPAISMIMCIKGHNGLLPCHMCKISGLRPPESRHPIHYVPLDRSRHPNVRSSSTAIKKYSPASLPLRTHNDFMATARLVQFAVTEAESERRAKASGIKGIPILSALSSLSFPNSFPYDFMHLIFENVIKNLVLLWTGAFKGLNEGTGEYVLPNHVWEAVGAAMAASCMTIPSCLSASPPNIADDKSSTTADTWSFWLMYLGPALLSR